MDERQRCRSPMRRMTRPSRRERVSAALDARAAALRRQRSPWPHGRKRSSKGGTLIVAIQDNPPHLLTGISVDILTICVARPDLRHADQDGLQVQARSRASPSPGRRAPTGSTYTLQPRARREMARRPAVHVGGREVHVPRDQRQVQSSLARAAYKDIAAIETPDDLTVVIKMKAPDPAFFPWAFSPAEFRADLSEAHLRGHRSAHQSGELQAGRHRPVQVQGMGARQPHRARAQPRLLPQGHASSSTASCSRSFPMRARGRSRSRKARSITCPISRWRRRRSSRWRRQAAPR